VTVATAPKQARSQAKLDRLLLAGRELFASEGFDGTRIGDVAERAGCSVGAFYSRFADKDSFFLAVQEHFLAEVGTASAELNTRASELGGVELLRAHIAFGVRVVRPNAGLIRAIVQYGVNHPGAWNPLSDLVEARVRGVAEAIERSGLTIGHPDPSTAVAVGTHVIRGTLLHEALVGPGVFPLDDDALVDELTDVFCAYLRVSDSGAAHRT